MSEKYGIESLIKDSIAQTPVSLSTEVVFLGRASSNEKRFVPVRCTSESEVITAYGTVVNLGDFKAVAKYAFGTMNIDHAWFINVGSSALPTVPVPEADMKAGIDGIHDIYNNHGAIPSVVVLVNNNLCAAPESVASYAAAQCLKISDKFKAQVFYDTSISEDDVETISRAGVSTGYYKIDTDNFDGSNKDCNSGNCVSFIGGLSVPYSSTESEPAKFIPLSVVGACRIAVQNSKNTGGVPYRSVGNLSADGGNGYCVYWRSSTGLITISNIDHSKTISDYLAAEGYVVLLNNGHKKFVLWGDHTSRVSSGGTVDDELYRFDSNVAIAYHLANRWILKWQSYIDAPMTLSLRNDIINEEQTYLDYLVSIGALIGNPKCEFKSVDNTTDTLQLGQFYFTNTYTSVIPAKYLQMNLVWTAEGLSAYTEE